MRLPSDGRGSPHACSPAVHGDGTECPWVLAPAPVTPHTEQVFGAGVNICPRESRLSGESLRVSGNHLPLRTLSPWGLALQQTGPVLVCGERASIQMLSQAEKEEVLGLCHSAVPFPSGLPRSPGNGFPRKTGRSQNPGVCFLNHRCRTHKFERLTLSGWGGWCHGLLSFQ